MKTEHRDAGLLAQLAEKDRQMQALQHAYDDTQAALLKALARLAGADDDAERANSRISELEMELIDTRADLSDRDERIARVTADVEACFG